MHDDHGQEPDDRFLAFWSEERSNYASWKEEAGATEAAADAGLWQDMDTGDEADDEPDGWDEEDRPTFH
ncbi:hypothetical protein [Kitasatospora sp. NPDC058046]|uniref:hypothetical protein n=1 Tax=Kitasatospora sp. NPDC058046 TaxID=3346312 RepID=UPI0036DDD04B